MEKITKKELVKIFARSEDKLTLQIVYQVLLLSGLSKKYLNIDDPIREIGSKVKLDTNYGNDFVITGVKGSFTISTYYLNQLDWVLPASIYERLDITVKASATEEEKRFLFPRIDAMISEVKKVVDTSIEAISTTRGEIENNNMQMANHIEYINDAILHQTKSLNVAYTKVKDRIEKNDEIIHKLQGAQQLLVQLADKTITIDSPHKCLPIVIQTLSKAMNPLLIGPSGTGKTYAVIQAAKALGMEYRILSVNAQTSKSDIKGYLDATGNYISSSFREMYEHGGIFLMDEIDAGNANCMVMMNSAISNGEFDFPDQKIYAHKDFRFVGAANTYGTGPNAQYVGRQKLDAATLDRFMKLQFDYDEVIERKIVGEHTELYEKFLKMREYVNNSTTQLILSTRTLKRFIELKEMGWKDKEIIAQIELCGISLDDIRKINEYINT